MVNNLNKGTNIYDFSGLIEPLTINVAVRVKSDGRRYTVILKSNFLKEYEQKNRFIIFFKLFTNLVHVPRGANIFVNRTKYFCEPNRNILSGCLDSLDCK